LNKPAQIGFNKRRVGFRQNHCLKQEVCRPVARKFVTVEMTQLLKELASRVQVREVLVQTAQGHHRALLVGSRVQVREVLVQMTQGHHRALLVGWVRLWR
jgi:hypothetical protein